jgi:Nucleoside 2-deoxyribosyltransferase like
MTTVLQPPTPLPAKLAAPSVFLAGSIDDGKAEHWQALVVEALKNENVVLLNPRRDHWEPPARQNIQNQVFRSQVNWELEAQERADLILMYFAPETKAPITLLELGLFARSGKLLVACPDIFWRKGNVEVVCARYGIPLVDSLDDLLELTKSKLNFLSSETLSTSALTN